MKPLPRLYSIADASFGDPVQTAALLFKAGIRLVQVRNKKGSSREFLKQVDQIVASAPPDARVIVNDRADITLIAGAHGVHLGQADLPPQEARRILGDGRIVGFSTHNLEQALVADRLPVDYVAVGPIFSTATKENPDPIVGVATLSVICKAIRKPVVAIGGVTLANAIEVLNAGAASVAVIRDLIHGPDVERQARRWLDTLKVAP
jgi:thiamine-phosphate pyrophosphorylase